MNWIATLLNVSLTSETGARDSSAPGPMGSGNVRRRLSDAINRRRRARGLPAVLAFLVGRPLRPVVSLEHYLVLARPTAGVTALSTNGLAIVRLEPNSCSLTAGGLVEGRPPTPHEGLPRGRSVWLGLRDQSGTLRGRAFLELEPERGSHRGWNPDLCHDEAVTSGLWIDPAVRSHGAASLLVHGLLAVAREEHGIRTVYGIVHRYNQLSMLLMRVVVGFTPVGDAWALRLTRRYRLALRSTLHRSPG